MKSLLCLSLLTLFIIIFAPFTAFASLYGEPVFQLGWFAASQGRAQHINIKGLIGDEFSVDRSTSQNLLIGLGYYFDWKDFSKVHIKYGVNAFYLAPTKVTGLVTQENLFTNLSYQYTRTNYPIYLASKIVIPCSRCHNIVFDLGIGPNIASIGGFKEFSLDGGTTLPDPHLFARKALVSFSATAGCGWRIEHLWSNCSLEIGYQFFFLGQGELKTINSQVINTLRTGNSYANALIISFSL